MTTDVDGNEVGDTHETWRGEKRGIVTLAAARYQAFEDEVDKVAANRQVERVELREALAHWVDHDLNAAVEAHDMPREVIIEAGEACRRAALQQYEWQYHKHI